MKKKNNLIKISSLIVILILFLGVWFVYSEIYIPKDRNSNNKILFTINPGESSKSISRELERKGLIKSSLAMDWYIWALKKEKHLIAGEYELSPSMSLKEIVNRLTNGKTSYIKITIPEGWDLRDIAFYFENLGIFQAEEFWEEAGYPAIDYRVANNITLPKDFSNTFSFLKDKPYYVSLEGYLFPDTYFIKKHPKVNEVIEAFLRNFDKKLTLELREKIKSQGKSIFEIITMASLLEKEAKNIDDKKIISGILWKRLKYGMPLQVDATINYITGKRSIKIAKDELDINSPYNTYKRKGLPLGPICNPGIDSIIAAIYPEETDYWYYLSTPQGKIIFSKTLSEHNLAKIKYLK